ncbi:hypothetical protein ACFQ5N_10710 [Lutibacter holmesii]|uniref:YbbR-like domain-containing protein n=1 Tax=Lutibacter holmesii TaxID=1137985 RepID=A0ABW3WRN1_9FLAO
MKTAQKISNLNLKNNRKLKVFLFFLVLTSIIWLLIALSKNYTSTAIFKVEYENLPVDKLVQNKPISEVEISINAPGFTLINYKIRTHKIAFNLNGLISNKGTSFLLPNTQLSYLNKQVSNETTVVDVLQDTIFFDLGRNISKKVVVKPNVDVKFKLGYNFIEDLKLIPDSIVITGPEKKIDSISEIFTMPLELADVHQTIEADLKLDIPAAKLNLKVSNKSVHVLGKVDKFTEGVFKIPVRFINEPENVTINPFPKEIEVVYRVGLSHFNKINENSVSVVFDYNQYKNDTLIQYLTPVIQQKSEFIHSLEIQPNQIEFLIQN